MEATTTSPDDPLSQLGRDLHALVQAHLPPIVSVERISALQSASWPRAAFRLQSRDGRTWKGRRFESAEVADRVARLSRQLPAAIVAPIVRWRDAALITEWTHGDVLAGRAIDDRIIERAGALLGAVHASVVPPGIVDSPSHYPCDGWSELLEARLQRLHRAGRITERDSARALALAERCAPPPEPVSLVLGDLSPENLVIDADGRLSIVDTDGLELHARAFDLARARYRWPMTDDEWRVFCRGYANADAVHRYQAHEPHWQVVVLAGAADFRVSYGLPGSEPALERLTELLSHQTEITQ